MAHITYKFAFLSHTLYLIIHQYHVYSNNNCFKNKLSLIQPHGLKSQQKPSLIFHLFVTDVLNTLIYSHKPRLKLIQIVFLSLLPQISTLIHINPAKQQSSITFNQQNYELTCD